MDKSISDGSTLTDQVASDKIRRHLQDVYYTLPDIRGDLHLSRPGG